MGFKKETPAAAPESAPVAESGQERATDALAKVTEMAKDLSPRDAAEARKVRGQVAMHAIIAGYGAAAALAPIVYSGPDAIRDGVHKLAAEFAAKIEAYSFKDS